MSKIHEETYYACSVEGCDNCVLDSAYISLGCAVHGNTLTRVVRQFEGNTMTSQFTEKSNG